MKTLALWTTIAFTLLVQGCASVETAKSELGTGASRTYPSPQSEVWDAALKALPELKISVVASDRTAGTITGSKSVSAFSWGERVALRITAVGDNKTQVEVISQRALVTNITATDWTLPILDRIGRTLLAGNGGTAPPLQGASVSGFNDYKQRPTPKAFALADDGHWAAVWGRRNLSDAAVAEEAVQRCRQRGHVNCKLYALNEDVVWQK
jgi:hypothetical protein